MLSQTLLPAFAVLGLAAAQTTSLCSQATATINSQADATQYASCSTISGDVLIGQDVTGALALDGPEQITGSLIAHNVTGMVTLSSSTLNSIGKTFDLFQLTQLSTLAFNELTSSHGIMWNGLPALSTLTFPAYLSQATDVSIVNTFLSSLDGINLAMAGNLEIQNNLHLKEFSTQIANVSGQLIISANGQSLSVEFPNLIWAEMITLQNVSSLKIPSLTYVNSSFSMSSNYFTNVSAPNLTTVGNFANQVGSFAAYDNSALTNITAPLLNSVGGAVVIENNTALTGVSFPALAKVGGSIDLIGNFTSFTLSSLKDVNGGAVIESESDISDACSSFKSGAGSAVQAKVTCTGDVGGAATAVSAISGSGSKPTGSGSGTSSSKAAAPTLFVNEALAGLTVAGGLLQMLL